MNKVEIGLYTLYLGDCYDVIKTIPSNSVTLVHSDPPYIVHSGAQNSEFFESKGINKQLSNLQEADISDGFDMGIMEEFERVCKCPNYQLWCSKKQFPELLKYAIDHKWSWQDIMLYRSNPLPSVNGKFQDKDYLLMMWKGRKITGDYQDKATGYIWTIGKKKYNHPAMKPVEPIIHMLRVGSDEGDVVLDPFMGSGTTGEACILTGRRFIGIEKNPEYFEMAVNRLKNINSEKSLF